MSYKSSPRMFEEFLKSSLWADMEYELDLWLEDIRHALENVDEHAVLLRLQGNAEFVRKMKNLPANVLENIKEDIERESKEEKNAKT